MPNRRPLPWVAIVPGVLVDYEDVPTYVLARPSISWAVLARGHVQRVVQVDPTAYVDVFEPTEDEALKIMKAFFPNTMEVPTNGNQ